MTHHQNIEGGCLDIAGQIYSTLAYMKRQADMSSETSEHTYFNMPKHGFVLAKASINKSLSTDEFNLQYGCVA